MTEINNNNTADENEALDPFTVALDALRQGKYRESLGGKTGVSIQRVLRATYDE